MTDQQALVVVIQVLLALVLSVGVMAFVMGGWVGLLVYALVLVVIVVGAAI